MSESPQPAAPAAWRQPLPCRGMPEALFTGTSSAYVTTDMGEWIRVTLAGETKGLPPLSTYAAAAVAEDDSLVVALYEPLLAVSRNGGWEYADRPAPVLSIARRGPT